MACEIQLASAFGLEVGDGLAQPTSAEAEAPQPAHRRQALGPALVQPDDGRPQRLAPASTLITVARWVVSATPAIALADRPPAPTGLAGLAQRPPVVLRVLLRPARVVGVIGLELDLVAAATGCPAGRTPARGRSGCRCRWRGCGRALSSDQLYTTFQCALPSRSIYNRRVPALLRRWHPSSCGWWSS